MGDVCDLERPFQAPWHSVWGQPWFLALSLESLEGLAQTDCGGDAGRGGSDSLTLGWAQECAFLASFQVMPMLPAWGPHFEKHWPKASGRDVVMCTGDGNMGQGHGCNLALAI